MVGGLTHGVEHQRALDEVAAAEGVVDVDSGARDVEEDVVGPVRALRERREKALRRSYSA